MVSFGLRYSGVAAAAAVAGWLQAVDAQRKARLRKAGAKRFRWRRGISFLLVSGVALGCTDSLRGGRAHSDGYAAFGGKFRKGHAHDRPVMAGRNSLWYNRAL